jgi:ribonuclease BN (tRNA processing enzyme)
MKVKLLGAHNSESQNTRLLSILIDDNLVLDAGGLTSSLPLPAQQKLKAILLTHQHYDHLRDVPSIAMNFYLAGATINIYSTSPVYEAIATHLLNSELYPNFMERPLGEPTIKFTIIEPYRTEQIEGYGVLAIPVNHSVPSVGYQVTSPDGKVIFYTGDTGPGLADCWQRVNPRLLITEVTASDRFSEFGRESGHLTPGLLKQELIIFQELRGYLPEVVAVHMSPGLEEEIRAEIAAVANDLDSTITLGYEGMELHL